MKTTINSDITSGLKGNAILEELGGDPVLHRLPRQHTKHERVLTPETVSVKHVGVVGQPVASTQPLDQAVLVMPKNERIQT